MFNGKPAIPTPVPVCKLMPFDSINIGKLKYTSACLPETTVDPNIELCIADFCFDNTINQCVKMMYTNTNRMVAL